MSSETLLEKIFKQERQVKQKVQADGISKNSSWVLFFAGAEFNQELEKQAIPEKNIIDFAKFGSEKGEWIATKIKEIHQDNKNQQLVAEKKFPIIWFKNIEKIASQELEQSLLPVFDHQQNTKLFSEKIDLSNYILIATSSTHDISQLPPPLASRLECINVETAQPKKFFLDKYFNWLLAGSLVLIIVLGLLIFWPSKRKKEEMHPKKQEKN